MKGDVIVICKHIGNQTKRLMFRFSFHTAFVQDKFILTRNQLDGLPKGPKGARSFFDDDFTIELTFQHMPNYEEEKLSVDQEEAFETTFKNTRNTFRKDTSFDGKISMREPKPKNSQTSSISSSSPSRSTSRDSPSLSTSNSRTSPSLSTSNSRTSPSSPSTSHSSPSLSRNSPSLSRTSPSSPSLSRNSPSTSRNSPSSPSNSSDSPSTSHASPSNSSNDTVGKHSVEKRSDYQLTRSFSTASMSTSPSSFNLSKINTSNLQNKTSLDYSDFESRKRNMNNPPIPPPKPRVLNLSKKPRDTTSRHTNQILNSSDSAIHYTPRNIPSRVKQSNNQNNQNFFTIRNNNSEENVEKRSRSNTTLNKDSPMMGNHRTGISGVPILKLGSRNTPNSPSKNKKPPKEETKKKDN